MAEISFIASMVQIADLGPRLGIKLYAFGEIICTTDKSVISTSSDVSLTSSVLKELGNVLDKDQDSRICSETADGIVKECLAVFEEIEKVLLKKMPQLVSIDGEKKKRATILLERLKWPYLQPRLKLMRSNLDRLKSTLNLMLNVIIHAKHVSDGYAELLEDGTSTIRTARMADTNLQDRLSSYHSPAKTMIEDLAKSNDNYVKKFEKMNLTIDATSFTTRTASEGPVSSLCSGTSAARFSTDKCSTNASTDLVSMLGPEIAKKWIGVPYGPSSLEQILKRYQTLMRKLLLDCVLRNTKSCLTFELR